MTREKAVNIVETLVFCIDGYYNSKELTEQIEALISFLEGLPERCFDNGQ